MLGVRLTVEFSSSRNLDSRIAEALANEATKFSVFSDLLIDIEHALPLNSKALEAERVRMLDPTNSDPDNSKRRVESITLERDRLSAAIPILQQRYAKAEHRERIEALKPRYNTLVAQHNKCAETLFTLYHDFCEQAVPLLDSTVKLNSEIHRMNADVHAKGFTEFPTIPTIAEHLIEKLVLPSGNGVNYWPDPKTANAVAVQWSDAVAQAYSSPRRQAASSPDWAAAWAAARAIQDEAKKAEWARINALQERQQAEAKREFEQSKKVAR